MTKLELIESWIACKGDQPYTFADLVSIVDEASHIGADLKQAEIVALIQDEIISNSDVQQNPDAVLGEVVVPNVGLMDALRIVSTKNEEDSGE